MFKKISETRREQIKLFNFQKGNTNVPFPKLNTNSCKQKRMNEI